MFTRLNTLLAITGCPIYRASALCDDWTFVRSAKCFRRFLSGIFLLASISAHGQLPAGTTDTTQSPASSDPRLTQLSTALQKHDFPTAEKLLTQLTAANPNDPHLLFDLGLTEENLDHDSAAEAAYRKAITADANYAAPHLALGLILARAGKSADARTELLAVANATPSPDNNDLAIPARALRALARIDLVTNAADARDELLAALKLSPETPSDILLSAQIAESLAQTPADLPLAEAAYRRFLTTNHDDPEAAAALAHILLREKKTADAEALLIKALAAHPADTALTAQLCTVYLAEADTDPAKSALAVPLAEALHQQHPENAAIARLLGRLYAQTGKPELAAPLYAALLAEAPNDPTLLDDAGDNLLHLRHYAEAEDLLKRAVAQPASVFPTPEDQAAAYSHLAFSASENNHPELTLQALDQRAKVAPNTAGSLFLLATAHDKLHQVKQASEAYKQFLAMANGKFPDQEWEARHRLITLEHMK